jgi:phage tail sheath protein FI
MAETLISPGVLARENDQSQITSQPVQAGAAIVGPTVLGRVGIPKLVTSYSEYLANYGSTFTSGSDTYTYFTSISAYNYFNNGGTSLLVTRVASGSYSPASSSRVYASEDEGGALTAGASLMPITSGGQGGAAGVYTNVATSTSGTGGSATATITSSTGNGKLLLDADALLAELSAGTNPTNCGVGTYTNIDLTAQDGNATGKATLTVTGTTAPTVTGMTVTTAGSGYASGDVVTIAAGALGTGQLINGDDVKSISNHSSLIMGQANEGVPTTVNISSVTGGSQQTGTGGSLSVTTADSGQLLTGADLLLANLNAGTNPTNAGAGSYSSVVLTAQDGNVSGLADITVTGTTAPTVTGITVTTAGTGYEAGDVITIAGAALGSGQLINGDNLLSISNGAALDMGAANVGVATPVNISSVTGGSQQTGAGGSVTVTTADNGKLLTGADELLAELNAGTNPTNCGVGSYSGVVLTSGANTTGQATLTVTGTTAPTVTGMTVTTAGSGYTAGDVVTIAAGALGTGQLINAQNVTAQSSTSGGTTFGTSYISSTFSQGAGGYLVTGGSQQTGDGATITITNSAGNVFVAAKALTLPGGAVTANSAGTTSAVATTSSGTGTGATLLITSDGTNITGAVISGVGSGGTYAVGDTITASKADMDADGSIGTTGGDLVITIASGDIVGVVSAVVVANIGTNFVDTNVLTITAAKLVAGGFTGCDQDFLLTLTPSNLQDSSAGSLTLATADIQKSVSALATTNIGTNYVASNVLTISQADLVTAGFTNASGDLTITLASGNVQDSAAGSLTLAADDINNGISALTVINIGTNYVTSNVLTVSQADLVTAGFTGAQGDLTVTLGSANVQNSSAGSLTLSDADLLVEVTGAVVGTTPGSNYEIGDTLTVALANIGNPTADAVFTLTAAMITNANVFTLETIAEGTIMNSAGPESSNGALDSGSANNVRWEIQAPNTGSGVFSLIIRQGNDNSKSKSILEVFPNVSLDPKQSNYIARIVGDMTDTLMAASSAEPYLQPTGSYRNASRYVRVKSIDLKTPDYFDNSGIAKDQYTGSIPSAQSGSMGGAEGTNVAANQNYYEKINNNDTQGMESTEMGNIKGGYGTAFNLLANKDDYRYNLLTAPGLVYANANAATPLNVALSNVQSRGDAILLMDMENYGATITAVTGKAASVDNSYAATYWPWVQINDPDSAQLVWCPASSLIPGVYAYNDKAAEAWFAPAGINRGGLSTVVQAERKLTQTNRDDLYTGKVNPIATFPGRGVVVFGQKTLQSQASALDRVNVRRLLIELKSYISQIADNLVFEQNTAATRNSFLAQVNPYLESVQQRQGLYAFKVVMDASNNGPDVVDRNQMVGAIYLQPTKTAEFIYLDFNILPTGAQFPS